MKLFTKVHASKKKTQWSGYDKQYALEHEEKKYPLNCWEYREILRMYKPTPKDKILEIGCNTGEFCYLLNSTYGCYVEGIDINSSAIKIAIRKYPGIVFKVADLMTLKDSGYDIIYMQHVIEHLENPKEALLLVRGLLKRNGLLFLSCPNRWAYISKLTAWMFLTRFCYDATHLYWFSPSSISKLLRRTGFYIAEIKTKPLGIPAKKIPYFLQNIYYNLPASFLGAYIFVLAGKS